MSSAAVPTAGGRTGRAPRGAWSIKLGAWAAGEERDALVVFDGRPPPHLPAPARVEVRFAERGGRDAADDVIAALVAGDEAPETLRVVTSDAELARRVREHGAGVTGARGFRDALSRAPS